MNCWQITKKSRFPRLKPDRQINSRALFYSKYLISDAKMLRNDIVRFLNFFDFLGFNFGASKLSHYPKLIKFIGFLEILAGIMLTMLKFQFLKKLYSLYGLLPAINERCMFSASLCSYWVIVLDSMNIKRSHKEF